MKYKKGTALRLSEVEKLFPSKFLLINRHIRLTLLPLVLMFPFIANAEGESDKENNFLNLPGEFSATVAFTTDYTFRGLTQNDEEPAIQGSLDYSLPVGDKISLYLGVWASNVDFNDSDEANTEFDWYGGFKYQIDKLSLDLGALYYTYPGAASSLDYDYYEIQAVAGYDFEVASLSASVNYTPENFGKSGYAEYYKLAGEVPLQKGFNLIGHIGRQQIDKESVFGKPDYTDWGIGLSYDFKGVDIKLEYIDTDLGKNECADGCDARAILSVAKSI